MACLGNFRRHTLSSALNYYYTASKKRDLKIMGEENFLPTQNA